MSNDMTLDEFCGQFGMVPAAGLDGSMLVSDFLADDTNASVPDSNPDEVSAFLADPEVTDDQKVDAYLRVMIDGEGDDEAIRHALGHAYKQYANA